MNSTVHANNFARCRGTSSSAWKAECKTSDEGRAKPKALILEEKAALLCELEGTVRECEQHAGMSGNVCRLDESVCASVRGCQRMCKSRGSEHSVQRF